MEVVDPVYGVMEQVLEVLRPYLGEHALTVLLGLVATLAAIDRIVYKETNKHILAVAKGLLKARFNAASSWGKERDRMKQRDQLLNLWAEWKSTTDKAARRELVATFCVDYLKYRQAGHNGQMVAFAEDFARQARFTLPTITEGE